MAIELPPLRRRKGEPLSLRRAAVAIVVSTSCAWALTALIWGGDVSDTVLMAGVYLLIIVVIMSMLWRDSRRPPRPKETRLPPI